MLREVIWNIRVHRPVDPLPRIDIEYFVSIKEDKAGVIISQRQLESKPWSEHPEIPPGIAYANVLYGPVGADIGKIEVGRPRAMRIQGNRDAAERYEIEYVVQVAFNLR
jgi:hypothetical protein